MYKYLFANVFSLHLGAARSPGNSPPFGGTGLSFLRVCHAGLDLPPHPHQCSRASTSVPDTWAGASFPGATESPCPRRKPSCGQDECSGLMLVFEIITR